MASKKWVVDLNLNQMELQNGVIQNLASAPANPKSGQHYFNTADHTEYVYNGTSWVDSLSQGDYTFQNGVELVSGTRNVQVKLGTSSNATVTADSTGLAVSVADASTSAKGVIEIATDAEASTGTSEGLAVNPKQLATKVTANAAITAGTATKITYDAKGLVTAGTTLSASDIPDISATYVPQTSVGAANGVASLGADGKVPSGQLPSYVDDVIELNTMAETAPATCVTGDKYYNTTTKLIYTATATDTWGTTGETPISGVIYVAKDTNASYRWGGSDMINIGNPISAATESTPGIAALATQAECTTGTNDTKIVTPLKMATYTAGMAKAFYASNTALTASGGVCTWTITNTLAKKYVHVHVYEESTGEEVMTSVTAASGTITIKINSASNIAAGTYFAVVIG